MEEWILRFHLRPTGKAQNGQGFFLDLGLGSQSTSILVAWPLSLVNTLLGLTFSTGFNFTTEGPAKVFWVKSIPRFIRFLRWMSNLQSFGIIRWVTILSKQDLRSLKSDWIVPGGIMSRNTFIQTAPILFPSI